MSEFIRLGIVGVGSIGKNHARIYSALPGVKFSAILDTNTEAADATSQEQSVPVATTLEEFASLVDAATVSTPTPHHYEIGKFLLKHGKHLLIEKPITETPELHDLEIILHLVRSPVKNIDAVGIPVLSKGEDIANARIRFESGCVANVTASRVSPEKMRKIRVFQEDAYLSLDYQKQSGEMFRLVNGTITREAVEIEKDEPLKRELLSFVECSRKGIQPVVSGSQAAAALELAIEITEMTKSATSELSRELGREQE